MEKQDVADNERRRDGRGRHVGGLVLVIVGIFLLLHNLNLDLPRWVFSWPSLLILVGILVGVRQQFRSINWLAMICIGSVFLFRDIAPDFFAIREELIWPVVLIVVGVLIYLRNSFHPDGGHCDAREERRRRWDSSFRPPVPPVPPFQHSENFQETGQFRKEGYMHHETTDDDYVYGSAIFSGTQKTVLSKHFQGGNLTAMFGGLEVNLMQADFSGTAVLHVTVFCGGAEIIVPGNWTVRLDETTLFGGSEDSRPASLLSPDPSKVLIIRGSCLFGGLEVKSY
ncbi:hypothetical protein GA0116948_105174 [Chitinophaga costaii]|uniref:LiaF transmembrane domain-containing protein n=1 Tax=Chitinophaga costaii TaxID=1335309 RepID=A0A1C4DB58_9BACT|nr:DUF5668 domain-containing protein [Chitinophaga costaii]PUZ24540.1 hypothetical protein DCM91_11630 [Chitinophaga costaii]SCC28493.1 hypothetical protein GA0116948_105174 [Chitinophaga costaii]